MSNNPLITTAAITSIISAVIAVLVAFGVQLSEVQITSILGLVAVAAPWVVALVGHNTTTPLSRPTDEDGTPLVRANSDNAPTLKQTRAALKM